MPEILSHPNLESAHKISGFFPREIQKLPSDDTNPNEISVYCETGKIKYLKFKIRGQKVPLNIEIKGTKEIPTVYYSQVTKRPNFQVSQKVFNKNKFRIYEKGFSVGCFSAKMAYLGILMRETSLYSVTITFGFDFNANNSNSLLVKIIDNSEIRKLKIKKTKILNVDKNIGQPSQNNKNISKIRKRLPLIFTKINV